jgi:hypothetical protein
MHGITVEQDGFSILFIQSLDTDSVVWVFVFNEDTCLTDTPFVVEKEALKFVINGREYAREAWQKITNG